MTAASTTSNAVQERADTSSTSFSLLNPKGGPEVITIPLKDEGKCGFLPAARRPDLGVVLGLLWSQGEEGLQLRQVLHGDLQHVGELLELELWILRPSLVGWSLDQGDEDVGEAHDEGKLLCLGKGIVDPLDVGL